MKKNISRLKKKIFLFFMLAVIVVGLMLFLPAGSLKYWAAWVFIGVLFIPVIFVIFYFLKHDPQLLERRIKFKEKEAKQKTIINISELIFFIGFLIPGFDYRYGWSNVPTSIIIISDIIIFLGYLLVFFVFKENSYTSRIIEVDKKQKIVTMGPYKFIRHPMYLGVILMFLFMPTALGSFWALTAFVPVTILIIFRAIEEEKVLIKNLKGYKGYMQKTKYRIIPGVW